MTISTLTYQIKASSSIIPESPKKYLKHKNPKLLKRIPLEKLMDLKVDYAFKQLFGNEKNKEITKSFLHAILQRSGRDRITDLFFLNTETGGEYADDKQSRLDLLVVTENNKRINVEIQFSNKYDMVKIHILLVQNISSSPSKGNVIQ